MPRARGDPPSLPGGPTMAAAADRHLLFGLLALQNGLIDQAQLVAAFHGLDPRQEPRAGRAPHRPGPPRTGASAAAGGPGRCAHRSTPRGCRAESGGHSRRPFHPRDPCPHRRPRDRREVSPMSASTPTQHEDADRTTNYSVGTGNLRRPAVPRPAAARQGRAGSGVRGAG